MVQVNTVSPRIPSISETTTVSLCCHGNIGHGRESTGLDLMPEGSLGDCASPFLPQSTSKMISASKLSWDTILIFGKKYTHTPTLLPSSIGTTFPVLEVQ